MRFLAWMMIFLTLSIRLFPLLMRILTLLMIFLMIYLTLLTRLLPLLPLRPETHSQ